MELKAIQLTKQYGSKTAVNHLNLSLSNGVYGLLGANGAGKTTLMRLLCDIQTPTSGRITLDGKNISVLGEKYRNLLGYLPQQFGYYPDFTAWDFLMYVAALKGLSEKQAHKKATELLEAVDLAEKRNLKIKTFSGGMKQRLGIAQAMLNNPRILILDEPTAGMDTTTRQRFWEIINDLKKSGVTILYSSHYIEEVEHTADRILVLHQGKLIRDTTPHAMRSEEKEKQVTLASRFAPSLDKLAAIYEVTEKRDVVTFMTKDIESIWSSLQAKGCRISDIEIQNKTLLDSLSDSTREDKS